MSYIQCANCQPTLINKDDSTTTIENEFLLGPCTLVIDKTCPDKKIKFFLFTRQNVNDRQLVHIDETWELSNISTSYFNPAHPVKIIIHGYNSDMFLQPLIDMKDG